MKLPTALKQYEATLQATLRPTVTITPTPAKTGTLESKFAGKPYWLKSEPYPTASTGEALHLLAQLNLSAIPVPAPFPQQGILQFFVLNDDLTGLNFDDMCEQKDFRVVYHEHIEQDETQWFTAFDTLNYGEEEDYFPIQQECALAFQLTETPISTSDYRFDELLGIEDVKYDVYEEIIDPYSEVNGEQGAKIGGYPYFTQWDPRGEDGNTKYSRNDILLLQIDSDMDNGILWGDCGVANFFIAEEDLRACKFDRVLYSWDCS